MKFKYNARTQEGELQIGFVESVNREAAVNVLTGHNLFILSLSEAEKAGWGDKIFSLFNKVKMVDLMIFTRQFATLLESKVPLGDCLRALRKQTRNPILKEIVFEISNDVDAGLSLSQALERHGNVFSEFYISLIRSSEITGRLEEAMVFLADYIDKELMWRTRIRNAMIYPSILIGLFVIVAGLMIVIVFPQIAPIFKEARVELPFITRILLAGGEFVGRWWWAIITVIFLFIVLLVDYFRSKEGKIVFDEISIKLPILGNLFKKVYIARFAESISVLIKGGIPITQSIEITAHSVGSIVYRDVLHDCAERVKAGETFSSIIEKEEGLFPPLVSQMIAIGEGTGRLDEILSRISILYTREVNDLLANLTELIQPLLIALIGVFVGLLFASILIPIYNLVQAF